MDNKPAKNWISLAALMAVCLIAPALLTSCENLGSGGYGPGTGHFATVVVDAGHGGHDNGARAASGAHEKMLALDTARRVAANLRGRGFHVIETRTGDYFVPLGVRADASNRTNSSIFVSIHYNWSRRRSARGIEIFYNGPRSMRLAANILRDSSRAYRTANRGVKFGRFHVLRNNRRPAVLCELGFISNGSENSSIQSASTRQALADRVAAGIAAEQSGRQP